MRSRWLSRPAVRVSACCLYLAIGLAVTLRAQPPEVDLTLLFTATHENNGDLFVRSATGTARLTEAEGADNYATWSPDGERVAFQSQRDGNYELYVMNADGSEQRNLSRHPGHDGLPVWSPDGSRIAFFSSRGFEYEERSPIPGHIYVVSSGGGEPTRLTRKPLTSTLGPSSWSPDGGYLLLARVVSGDSDLFRLEIVSGREERLTASPSRDGGARYSPDGASIAYYEEGAAGAAIVVVASDGTGRRVVLDNGDFNYNYAWSPDGEWLSVTAITADGAWSVKAVALDGRVETLVEAGAQRAREGSWRPGGQP